MVRCGITLVWVCLINLKKEKWDFSVYRVIDHHTWKVGQAHTPELWPRYCIITVHPRTVNPLWFLLNHLFPRELECYCLNYVYVYSYHIHVRFFISTSFILKLLEFYVDLIREVPFGMLAFKIIRWRLELNLLIVKCRESIWLSIYYKSSIDIVAMFVFTELLN